MADTPRRFRARDWVLSVVGWAALIYGMNFVLFVIALAFLKSGAEDAAMSEMTYVVLRLAVVALESGIYIAASRRVARAMAMKLAPFAVMTSGIAVFSGVAAYTGHFVSTREFSSGSWDSYVTALVPLLSAGVAIVWTLRTRDDSAPDPQSPEGV